MEALELIHRQQFQITLKSVSLRQLMLFTHAPCALYVYERGEYITLFNKGESLTKKLIHDLITGGQINVYCKKNQLELFHRKVEKDLLHLSRALSSGQPYKNAMKLLNLLTLNFEVLYKKPFNSEALLLQYKSLLNLKQFLENNPRYIKKLYNEYKKQQFPYIFSQPILSSLILLAYLLKTSIYSSKETEEAFIASMFKDLGMAIVPDETRYQKRLQVEYKSLIAQHPQHSYQIIKNKIPLSKHWMRAITNHHALSAKIQGAKVNYRINNHNSVLVGFETVLLGFFDVFTAMTSDRPYRNNLIQFKALDEIKEAMNPVYKAEFNSFVKFLFNFFN